MPKTIVKKEKPEQEQAEEKAALASEKAVVSSVMETLGKPKNLSRVKACNVYNNKWRVTVYLWSDTGDSEHPADSFFLTVEDGKIVASNPELKKRY